MPKWEVTIDPDVCVGSGTCISREPDFFEWDADQSRPIRAIVDDEDAVQDAAEMCPAAAIRVTALPD